jgi:hypothetical protein
MAITLTQLAHQVERRTWQPPTSNLPARMHVSMAVARTPQYANSMSDSPLPEDWYNSYYMPPPVRTEPAFQPYYPALYSQSQPLLHQQVEQHHQPLYQPPVSQATYSYLPPPLQLYHQTPDSPHESTHSGHYSPIKSLHSPSLPPTPPPRPTSFENQIPNIEPDPLPPHSNPQALTASQSQAFEDSSPLAPVRIGREDVYCTKTGLARYAISRIAAHNVPSFLSTKPILTVTKTSTGIQAGQIKFHTITTSSIEMTLNGKQTTISHKNPLLHSSRRWGFTPTSAKSSKGEGWYWKKDRSTAGALLEAKNGKPLARMKGDLLTFEKSHLTTAEYDEIVMSAVAMAEAARRASKRDIVDLANAIGDFTSRGCEKGGGGAT